MRESKSIDSMMRLKEWESAHLPASDSIVGHRLFLHLIGAFVRGENKSVKMLCTELGFSPAAVRVQIRRLEREGWVTVSNGTTDSRLRVVKLTQGGKTIVTAYERQILRLFE